MGASHSTPNPLISVSVPNGEVLVPSGSPLTLYAPSHLHRNPHPLLDPSTARFRKVYGPPRSRTAPHIPIYTPCSPHRRQARYAGCQRRDECEGADGSERTESEGEGMMGGGDPRMGLGGMAGLRAGLGAGRAGYFDDERTRSVPEVGIGGRMGMGMGVGGQDPRMGGMGGMPPGFGGGGGGMGMGMGMGPGGMPGGMSDPRAMQQPPEYTSNPQFPHFNTTGGLDAPPYRPPPDHMNTYTSSPFHNPTSLHSSTSSPRSTHRPTPHGPSNPRSKDYTSVPMGAYTTSQHKPHKPTRRNTSPNFAALVNRTGAKYSRVAASGKEWTGGNAFLDACTCTTDCKCRKSHRVMYRRERQPRDGSDDDGEHSDARQEVGEIRYILRDDLGKDCGDHSGCKKGGSGSGSDSEGSDGSGGKGSRRRRKSEKKKKRKEEEKKRKEEEKKEKEETDRFRNLKAEILEALDDRFQGIREDGLHEKQQQQQQLHRQARNTAGIPQSPFGLSPFAQEETPLDPRIIQHQIATMRAANPQAMNTISGIMMPPNMANPPHNYHPWNPDLYPMDTGTPFPDHNNPSPPDMHTRHQTFTTARSPPPRPARTSFATHPPHPKANHAVRFPHVTRLRSRHAAETVGRAAAPRRAPQVESNSYDESESEDATGCAQRLGRGRGRRYNDSLDGFGGVRNHGVDDRAVVATRGRVSLTLGRGEVCVERGGGGGGESVGRRQARAETDDDGDED